LDQPVTTLVFPEPNADSFTVGGITYTLEPDLSVARAKVLQRFQLELAYDTSLKGIIDLVDKGWEALNKGQLAAGIFEFGKLRESLNGVGSLRMSDVNICALFFNAPDEDAGSYNHAAMQEKIKRWEGVAAGFFTVAAFARLSATSTRYPHPAATLSPPTLPTTEALPSE
jgi:hypothetical protein